MAGLITRALRSREENREGAEEALWRLVYRNLRTRARFLVSRERRGAEALDPTELVHAAYAKICKTRLGSGCTRDDFFRIATRAMRQALVDVARKRRPREPWDEQRFALLGAGAALTLDERLDVAMALDRLASTNGRRARIVELRFYGGASLREISRDLGISYYEVKMEWVKARHQLRGILMDSTPSPVGD